MQQFWVFGYGSLMWRPGFEYVASEPAIIHGYHRRLCVYSHVHRGTPERPGLVLGLDRGGSCHGMAFQVAPERWEDTLSYLRSREQITMVYIEKLSPVRLLQRRCVIRALTYVVDRKHRQYAGILQGEGLLEYVRNGEGISGRCADYVLNTALHLRDMKIHDAMLERLVLTLERQANASVS